MTGAQATGDEELANLTPELRSIADDALVPVHAEPHAAAITGLLVSDFLQQPRNASFVTTLVTAGVAASNVRDRVRRVSRSILCLVGRLGGAYLPDGRVSDRLLQKGTDLRATMVKRLEEAVPGSVDARLWLDAIRRGDGPVDLVFDLRALATLFVDHLEPLADFPDHRGDEPPEEVARTARRLAVMVEHALRAGETDADREHRSLLGRSWTLFVPAYEELCRIGRFASRAHRDERHFPPLAMIAANCRAKRRPASLVPNRGTQAPPPLVVIPPASIAPRRTSSGEHELVDDDPSVELLTDPPPRPTADATDRGVASPVSSPIEPPPPPPALAVEPRLAVDAPLADDPLSDGEARQKERRRVEVEVAFCTSSNFYLGFTENLSEGGVFVATYCPQPIGSRIEIELHLPTGSLKVLGVVRWLRMVGASEDWPGMGVQFERLGEDDEQCIREFLAVREPLFFDST